MGTSSADQYDPRYDRGDYNARRTALDNERVERVRRAAVLEGKIFHESTRDLRRAVEAVNRLRPNVIEALSMKFTADELEVF